MAKMTQYIQDAAELLTSSHLTVPFQHDDGSLIWPIKQDFQIVGALVLDELPGGTPRWKLTLRGKLKAIQIGHPSQKGTTEAFLQLKHRARNRKT